MKSLEFWICPFYRHAPVIGPFQVNDKCVVIATFDFGKSGTSCWQEGDVADRYRTTCWTRCHVSVVESKSSRINKLVILQYVSSRASSIVPSVQLKQRTEHWHVKFGRQPKANWIRVWILNSIYTNLYSYTVTIPVLWFNHSWLISHSCSHKSSFVYKILGFTPSIIKQCGVSEKILQHLGTREIQVPLHTVHHCMSQKYQQ